MDLPRFVPSDLRTLARFVPSSGWNAIEWKPMLTTMRKLSWQLTTGKGIQALRPTVAKLMPDIEVADEPRGAKLGSVDADDERRRLGDDVLALYFAQLRSDEGLFLDLRPQRFRDDEGKLRFIPNGMHTELRPAFREGMIDLYRAFYSGNDDDLEAALERLGMIAPDLGEDDVAELKELLHAHFGVSQSAQKFAIDDFKASFDKLFQFFVEHNYKLHPDFVVIGFYLVTLYLTLETLGQAHDVRRICNDTLLS